MEIYTTRFGTIDTEPDAILFFAAGLIGFEDCQHWVLLPDAENPVVGWLQCVSRPDLALAVVSPRGFVPNYRVRVSRRQLEAIQLGESDEAYVLTVVARNDHAFTLNLRAPVIINLQQRLGHQVITLDDQSLQHEFADRPLQLRKSA